MMSWSGWSLMKREAPKPQIDLREDRVPICPPSLTELLGIQVPYATIGMIVVFGVGLVITARSVREFLPEPET